jgi:hypothetical protein
MTMFRNSQRVIVVEPSSPLFGKTGIVVRLRYGDHGAWVRMDENIPEAIARFSVGDDRRNDIILYPDQCNALK